MSVSFNEYFVGEYNGYEILYHNMKHGLNASKELADFFRERSNIEETNSKLLTKLAKQANGSCNQGTFAPMWSVLRSSAEKLSTLHHHMLQKVSELVKDVTRYTDDLHKKHKAVKDSESGTLEVALALQSTKQALHKAKDLYTSKSAELEKAKENSAKDIEKLELKVKKLHDDYKGLLEKYSLVKQDFEKKMSLTCKHFQDVEEAHLKQMKQFVNSYIDLVQSNYHLVGQVHVDMRHQCMELSVDKLLEQFIVEKYSSMEKSSPVDLNSSLSKPISANNSISESDQVLMAVTNGSHKNTSTSTIMKLKKEPSIASKTSRRTTSLLNLFTPFQSKDEPSGSIDGATPCSAPSSPSGTPAPQQQQDKEDVGRNNLRESKWFLRSRRTKPKLKKSKKRKEDGGDQAVPTEDKSDLEEKEEETIPKDAESVQSPQVDEDGYCIRPKEDKRSMYSTSDSDSEEEREQKIHVEIKPLNGGGPMSASVDELLATVENLSLFSTRRGSMAQSGKPSSDLLGLNLFQSASGSHPSSPLAVSSYAPLNQATSTPTPSPDVGDLFSEVGDMKLTTPSTSSIAIPRPPSRRSEPGEFRTAGVTGSSRGPSPLTIGMADTIPLAVAFHEIIHSYFRGSDESKCQVRMSGDMMLSFPTGIVGVLANNPSPAKLSFRLRNTSKLDNITPNKQLVSLNTLHSTSDSAVLEFNMPALTSLLKRQSEKNPGASYFNVDILKYQVKPKYGASSCPFQLVSYWKCENTHTAIKVDYKYNSHAMSCPSPLLNLSVSVPVCGGVDKVTAMPSCQTLATGDSEGLLWKFTELSQHSDNHGVGSLRARVDIANGPSSKSTITAQFNCEGATLSGIEFELVGTGYRLSLVKRRFVSGKYISDGD